MPASSENARLALAFVLSLLLHGISAAFLTTSLRERDPLGGALPPPPAATPLGIRDSNATTITWIGFREPTPHAAKESTLEQAAQEIGGGRPAPQALRRFATETTQRAVDQAQLTLRALTRALQSLDLTVTEEPISEQLAETNPSPAAPTPARPAPAAPTPGNAERQADAVSIEQPLKIEWGKPIAAEGLEILTRTKGPDFTAYTSVTARPKPLFVEISFGAPNDAGLAPVTYVELIGSSGNPDIDRPYLDVIYLWRARGERVDVLQAGETVKVRMRIIVSL